jgi:uncharacterized damage-inducible protein DinB
MDALAQYNLVKSSREVVFQTCKDLKEEYTFVPEGSNFSVRDMQVHIAVVYQYWLLQIGQGIMKEYAEPVLCKDVDAVRAIFTDVNDIVEGFCHTFHDDWSSERTFDIPSRSLSLQVSPLTIFTHAITHEFHHKGQIMKMARQLGIVPPDTDIIRF